MSNEIQNQMLQLCSTLKPSVDTLKYGHLTFGCDPKWHFFVQNDQDTLIIWTDFAGPKVSIIHRFHSIY